MVPWHPPCALCSLIFSSLILRPIVVTLFRMCSWLSPCPILRIATGLSKSFSVQLSRCKVRIFGRSTDHPDPVQGQALKTIQTEALSTVFPNDAMRLADLPFGYSRMSFQTSVFFRLFPEASGQQLCFSLSKEAFPFSTLPIDLRFGVHLSVSAFSLERR